MQNEAKRRVMEMHNRSLQAKTQMERDFGLENKTLPDENTAKAFVDLPQEPKNYRMPVKIANNQGRSGEDENRELLSTVLAEQKEGEPEKTPEPMNNAIGNLSQDELEKMFLLSLSLLLSHEQADEGVLLALMYLAM